MSETLTLTTVVTYPSLTTWSIVGIHLDKAALSIKIDVLSDTGNRQSFRFVDGENGVTKAQIVSALSSINQGKFATLQGKSLQKWLLEQMQDAGFGDGAISGSPD